MSVKLTVAFFILICFEIGALLAVLPWDSSWSRNHLLFLAAERMHWPGLIHLMMSGYVRGAISGLGILNIVLGVWEIVNFKKTVRAFQSEWESDETESKTPSDLPDNRPAETHQAGN